jgi:hypothetical protein
MKYARTVIISALLLVATSLAAQCQERQIVIAANSLCVHSREHSSARRY